jgi:hypothetical protein
MYLHPGRPENGDLLAAAGFTLLRKRLVLHPGYLRSQYPRKNQH